MNRQWYLVLAVILLVCIASQTVVEAIQNAVDEPRLAPEKEKPGLSLLRTDPVQGKSQHFVFQGLGTGPIHRVGPEHFKVTRVNDGKEITLLAAYDREELETRRADTKATPASKDVPVHRYNSFFKGVRFQLDNGRYDAKDLMHEVGYLELFGRATLEPGIRYRLTWACWPVGAMKATEVSCEFELSR